MFFFPKAREDLLNSSVAAAVDASSAGTSSRYEWLRQLRHCNPSAAGGFGPVASIHGLRSACFFQTEIRDN